MTVEKKEMLEQLQAKIKAELALGPKTATGLAAAILGPEAEDGRHVGYALRLLAKAGEIKNIGPERVPVVRPSMALSSTTPKGPARWELVR